MGCSFVLSFGRPFSWLFVRAFVCSFSRWFIRCRSFVPSFVRSVGRSVNSHYDATFQFLQETIMINIMNLFQLEEQNLRKINSTSNTVQYTACSTTGKPTRSFATERVSLDSV